MTRTLTGVLGQVHQEQNWDLEVMSLSEQSRDESFGPRIKDDESKVQSLISISFYGIKTLLHFQF